MQRGNKIIDGGGGKDIVALQVAEFNGDYIDGTRNDNGTLTLYDTRPDGLFNKLILSNINAIVTPSSIHILDFNIPFVQVNNLLASFWNDTVDGVYQQNSSDKFLYSIDVKFDVWERLFDTTVYAKKIMNASTASQFNTVMQEIIKLGAKIEFNQTLVVGADINADGIVDKDIRSGISYDPNSALSTDWKSINFNVKQGWMHFNLKQSFLKVETGLTNAWINGTNDTQSGNMYYANGNDNGYFTASLNANGSYKITLSDTAYLSDLSNAKTIADFNSKYNAAQSYFSEHKNDMSFGLGYYVDLKWAAHKDINGDGVADDSLGFGVNYKAPSATDTSITMSLQPYNPPAKTYTIHDIGTLPGYANSIAKAVSNDGTTVVGWSYNSDGTKGHAFVYDKTGMHDIGALGGDFSIATGVSFDGSVVVGSFHTASGQEHGIMHDIGTIIYPTGNSNYFSRVQGVSSNGRYIVGESDIAGFDGNHAFKYDTYTQQFTDLGLLYGFSSNAFATNLDGSVVAGQIQTSSGAYHAAVFKDGKIIDLGTSNQNYTTSSVLSMSDDGKIILGFSGNASSGNAVGFEARLNEQGNYVMQEIAPTSLNSDFFAATDAASYGSYISGLLHNSSGSSAYLYDNNTYTVLGGLGNGYVASIANAISLNGNVIVGGSSQDSSAIFGATIAKPDNTHAVVWTTSDVKVGPYVSPGPPAPLAANQFYNPVNGHVYEYALMGFVDWPSAKYLADSKLYSGAHGYLATITSQDELNFIKDNILPNYMNNENLLIGGEYIGANSWQWADGPEKGTVFWNNGPVSGQYENWYKFYGFPVIGTGNGSSYTKLAYGTSYDGSTNGKFVNTGGIGYNFLIEYSDFSTLSSSTSTSTTASQASQFIQASAAMSGSTASGNIASNAPLQDQQSLLITTKPI